MFRSEENYHFFLRKIREHLLPIGDVLCYCLMPDHFHLLFRLCEEGCKPSISAGMRTASDDSGHTVYMQEFSHQLRIMLSSYTKAFNRRYNRRGSLFRAKTKAKLAYLDFQMAEPTTFGYEGKELLPYAPYLRNCFHYIHRNPVTAHLALSPEEWPFSSAADYKGLRAGTLCNYELTERLLGIKRLRPPG